MVGFSAIVDDAGNGDHTTINAAISALAAGDSIYVKTGTYAGAVDVSKAVHVHIEPGTTFSSTFDISANKASVLHGNGGTVSGLYTISGDDCWMKARNGLDTVGMTVTGDRFFHDGGGWGTLHDGGTARIALVLSSGAPNDFIIQNCRFETTTGVSGSQAVNIGGATSRGTMRLVQIVDSEQDGVNIQGNSDDILFEGVEVVGADAIGISWNGQRGRIIGNHIKATGSIGLAFPSSADNCVVVGTVIESAGGDEIDIDSTGANFVIVANRVFGTIDDNSGTSIVQYNDLGTITCTVTGTWQSASITETDVVNGGATLILTLANGVWQNISMTNALWAPFFSGSLSEANDWDAEESTILADAAIVRTSDTVVTITLQAAANYDIDANETVTLTDLDGTVLASDSTVTPDDTSFLITSV